MKLGNIDIRKAYMGSRELTAANAFIGTTPIVPSAPTTRDYLTFTCVEAGSVGMTNYGNNAPNIEYSLNGGTWTTWDYSTITMTVGDKVKMRGVNKRICSGWSSRSEFTTTGKIAASGNIMSLIDGQQDGTKVIPTWHCFCYLFRLSTGLITPPELPATTITYGCYNYMFEGCTNLTTSPILPAMTLAKYCYSNMFDGCTSLSTTPSLPAMTLADYCYVEMFKNCTSLTSTPSLPATNLASGCYYGMLYGTTLIPDCTNIDFTSTQVVNCGGLKGLFNGTIVTDSILRNILPINESTNNYYLPVTSLGNSCYAGMFYNCTYLTKAPELPATTLAASCYSQMFSGCSNLTIAPELPATTLTEGCYWDMFYNCSKIDKIKCYATNISATNCLTNWLNGVSMYGEFSKQDGVDWPEGVSGIPSLWIGTYANEYLTFTGLELSSIGMTNNNNNLPNVEYSLNNGEWTTWDYSNIILGAGDNVRMRGVNANGFSHGTSMYSNFRMTGKVACSGNIMSLIDGQQNGTKVIPNSYCFSSLFDGCESLTNAPVLTATTLAEFCYNRMFEDCTNLTTASVLHANELAEGCYNYMFHNCTRLTKLPLLNAQTLARFCYNSMFNGCTSIVIAPKLPATTIIRDCYSAMFEYCTSLTTATLPASVLQINCYGYMFYGCSSLNNVTCLATHRPGIDCVTNWLKLTAATGTFTKAAGVQWPSGNSGIPSGWTVIEQ